MAININHCLRLFVVVYKLVNVGFDIRVVLCIYQYTKSHSQERKPNQVMAINLHVLLPEAVCCCLHTCSKVSALYLLRFLSYARRN